MTTIIDLLPDYERFLRYELQRADATVYGYLSDLRKLAESVAKSVDTVTKNDVRAYMQDLGKSGHSRATVRRSVNGMSTFWKWMMDEGYVAANVTSGIVLPKRERKMLRWLSEAELRRFATTPDPNPRNMLAWLLLAWLGLRRNEVRGLRCGDVSLSDGLIVVRNTKGNVDRTLPIPDSLMDDLRAATYGRPEAEYLLTGDRGGHWGQQSFYKAFNAHAAAASVSGITPHNLRHTFGTHMSQRGVPLRIIQQWMGHARIDTTSLYLQVAPEFMSAALDKHVLSETKNSPD